MGYIIMINLDATDVLEGIASVDAVVKFTVSGRDETDGLISKEGTAGNTNTEFYTAVGITLIYSITLYNSHSSAVTLTLNKDPANAGILYPYFSVSLGVGYSLVFDGQRCTVMDTNGNIITSLTADDSAYGAGWNGSKLPPTQGRVYDEIETKMALTGANLAIGSDANGDIYYRAANALARLGLGGANKKLFLNAGNTAPEWAVGMKIGSFLRAMADASGTQAVSGIGFKPSLVIFLSNRSGTAATSIGCDDGTLHYVIADNQLAAADTWLNLTTYSINMQQGAGVMYQGKIDSLDADGFTIAWLKTGATAGTMRVMYIAFR